MPEKTFNCTDCGENFTFSEKEQSNYADKGFIHAPTRCLKCHRIDIQKTKFFKKQYTNNRWLGG
jgi:hypothetical protein